MIFSLLFSVTFTACDDANDWKIESEFDRLFRPGNFLARNITATTAELSWNKIPGAHHYILQLSQDSLFQEIEQEIETATILFTAEELAGTTEYYARVQSISADPTIAESKFAEVTFTTRSEQIMSSVLSTDRTDTSVALRWIAGSNVTEMIVSTADDVVVQTIEINEVQKEAGEMLVTGLNAETTYSASIFNGTNRRGTVTFRTLPAVPGAERVIFLAPTDSLNQETFDTLTVSNLTIALPAGSVYCKNTSLVLPDGLSVTFFGLGGGAKPILSFNDIKLNSSHGTIRFENIDLDAFEYLNGVPTTNRFLYLFNQAAATTVERLEFIDCVIRNFGNTPIRLQGTANKIIETLLFEGVTAYNQGMANAYGFIHTNVAQGIINNILIYNSTFYNLEVHFILHTGAGNNQVEIRDCTFDNVIGVNRYFIDFNTVRPNSLTIANTIFGSTFVTTARGIRVAAGTTPLILDCWKTASWVTGSNAIAGLTDYVGTSTALFVNPAQGDFTILDDLFAGKSTAGALQWRIN